jgi:hypothetical protein
MRFLNKNILDVLNCSRSVGIPQDRIVDMVWWQEFVLPSRKAKITYTPSNHWDRFYKTLLRPKSFTDKFSYSNCGQVSTQQQNL